MSTLTCAEMRDLAPELALGVLGGAERAEALVHIDRCSACRSVVGDLTDAAESLPLVVTEAEPPAGFEGRVLGGLRAGRRRARRRWIAAVAVTAAAAAIVSIVVVRVVDRGRSDAPVVADGAVSDVWSAPMVDPAGDDVGWAFVSDGRPAAVGLWVNYAIPAGEYTIEATRGDGSTIELGTMRVADGRGAWAGTAPTAPGDVVVLGLRDAAGDMVCTATGVI